MQGRDRDMNSIGFELTHGLKRFMGSFMSTLGIVLLVVLLVMLFGSFPAWDHSKDWGTAPVSVVGFLLIIVLVLLITRRL